MNLTDVIRRPLITEKTSILREDGKTIVFHVAAGANKIDIKRAVEHLLGAKVASVRTSIAHGKVEAAGPFRRAALRLEAGLRPAARRREAAGVPRGRVERGGSMAIRSYKPTSPGRRFQTIQDYAEITTAKPFKPLTEHLKKSGGRNNHGEITVWWRGGGHRRLYRTIDFKRDKVGIPGKIVTVEYDPNRSARIALVQYADGEKRYILQPVGLKVGDSIVAGDTVDILRATRCRSRTSRWARRSTTWSCGRGRAGKSPGAPARRCSWWRRTARTRR